MSVPSSREDGTKETRPRIVLVWTNLAQRGGVRTFLFDCLDQLPGLGLDVFVLDVAGDPLDSDREVARCGSRIQAVPRRAWDSENGFWRRVRRTLCSIRPDLLVFVEWVFADSILAVAPPGVPAVALCFVDRSDAAYYQRPGELCAFLRGFVGNSRTIAERLRQVLPGTKLPIHCIPLGVEIPAARRNEDGQDAGTVIRLIFAQRLETTQKRSRDLVGFVAKLRDRGCRFLLDVVGDGEDAAYLRQALAGEATAGLVRFHGALPLPETLDLMEKAHIFLLFSAYEGMPLSLQHAMAGGVVPVVTDIESGIRDVLKDGDNARLFPVGDVDAAAGLVAELERNRTEWNRLAQAARLGAAQFDRRASMAAYGDFFARHAEATDWRRAGWPGAGLPLRTRFWLERPNFLRDFKRLWRKRGAM